MIMSQKVQFITVQIRVIIRLNIVDFEKFEKVWEVSFLRDIDSSSELIVQATERH